MIIPIGDRILVKPKAPDEKTKSGILLTQKEDEKQDQGIVIAVGDGEEMKRFKKGEKIIYQRFGPANIEIEKEKFVIVHLDEILGVIK